MANETVVTSGALANATPAEVKAAAEANKPERRTLTVDVPEGRIEPDTKRGYDQGMFKLIMDSEREVVAVREDEVVQINGVRFFVGGPDDGAPYQSVSLPAPIAEVLRNQRNAEIEAGKAWRRSTSRTLGGTKPDEIR